MVKKQVQTFTVHAFCKNGRGGNPAGVVFEGHQLSDQDKQSIAATLGHPETAFIEPSSVADHRICFFAPLKEVPLCGHATIASYALMGAQGKIKAGVYRMETKAGVLPVELLPNGEVVMDQNLPEFGETIESSRVWAVLGIDLDAMRWMGCPFKWCQPGKKSSSSRWTPLEWASHPSHRIDLDAMDGLPIQVVSTGLRKIFCPVESFEKLKAIVPDFEGIKALSRSYKVTGIYCFALDPQDPSHIKSRNFAPLVGIKEDAATGTSVAALSCYLYHHGIKTPEQYPLSVEQGSDLKDPGYLLGHVKVADEAIAAVQVSGAGALTSEVVLSV